jgi:hypothetical protein
MSKTGYIYGLFDPRDNIARYIGQTRNEPMIRLLLHWQVPVNKQMAIWIADLDNHNLRPILRVLERPCVDDLEGREHYWIAAFCTHKVKLLNVIAPSYRALLESQEPWNITNDVDDIISRIPAVIPIETE